MSEYIKKSSIIGLAHKLAFGRIITDREVEVVEMVVNSVHDDVRVDLVRCGECKHFVKSEGVCYLLSNNYEPTVDVDEDDYCSRGERKEEEDE